jgi:hypothetical protein
MQPLDLNLSSHPFRNNLLPWAGHVLACVLLLAFSAWNVTAFLAERRDLGTLRKEVAENERRMTDLDLRERRAEGGAAHHDLKDLARQATTANDVIMMKALSWTRLFNQLEKVVPHEVKTVAIRPTFGTWTRGAPETGLPEESVPVEIQGTAQSLEAFLEFERALLVDPHFDRVEPERADVVEGGEITFKIGFLYFAEGRKGQKEIPNLPHFLAAAGEEAASPEEAAWAGRGASGPEAVAPSPPPPPSASAPRQAPARVQPKAGAKLPPRVGPTGGKGGGR